MLEIEDIARELRVDRQLGYLRPEDDRISILSIHLAGQVSLGINGHLRAFESWQEGRRLDVEQIGRSATDGGGTRVLNRGARIQQTRHEGLEIGLIDPIPPQGFDLRIVIGEGLREETELRRDLAVAQVDEVDATLAERAGISDVRPQFLGLGPVEVRRTRGGFVVFLLPEGDDARCGMEVRPSRLDRLQESSGMGIGHGSKS